MMHDLEALGLSPDNPDVIAAIEFLDRLESEVRSMGVATANYLFLGRGCWSAEERIEIVEGLERDIATAVAQAAPYLGDPSPLINAALGGCVARCADLEARFWSPQPWRAH